MDTKHFFRTALNERGPKDSFFNEMAPQQPAQASDPNSPDKLNPKQPPVPGGDRPPTATQPPVTNSQAQPGSTAPNTNPGAAQAPGSTPGTPNPAPGAPKPATPAPAATPSQKAVSSMTISGQGDTEISNGITLPAGTPASIAPGDLSGNVSVTFAGKSYSVPDANLKQLIKSGNLKVDQAESMSKGFLNRVKAFGI